MEVTLRIRRYNPERDRKPHLETYTVEGDPNDQVLDLLNRVKWEQDGTLSYRRSCGHGICGSDAMRINGVNRLACKVLVREVGAERVIFVKGDPDVVFASVATVIDIAKGAGIDKVGLITQNLEEGK